jgi:hypothetical protein
MVGRLQRGSARAEMVTKRGQTFAVVYIAPIGHLVAYDYHDFSTQPDIGRRPQELNEHVLECQANSESATCHVEAE